MKNIIKNAMILTVITLVSGLLLGFVYDITKEPIAKAKEQAKNEAYQTVMQEADTFEALTVEEGKVTVEGCVVDEVVAAKAGSELKGYVITTTTNAGYGGNIQVSVGIAADGTVKGIEMLSIAETAGLGMNADSDDFKSQFVGKSGEIGLNKNNPADNEIQALTGATITSKAVTDAVNIALELFEEVNN